MSVQAMAWAMDQHLPPTRKLLLLVLADYTDANNVCWPSLGVLATKVCVGRDAIKDHMRALREDGLIVARSRRREDGSLTSNEYTLMLPGTPLPEPSPKGLETPTPGSTLPHPGEITTPGLGVAGTPGLGVPGPQLNRNEPSVEPPVEPNSSVGSPGGERDKVGRDSIDRVWKRHLQARRKYFRAKNGAELGREPDLTPELARSIREAIRRHGEAKATAAGVGIFYSPFHTGKDPKDPGKEFLDPSLCWRINPKRNAVEEFSRLHDEAELVFERGAARG